MSTYSNTAREVEMPNGDVVVLHNAVTENTTSNIKKFKYDDNGHVTESTDANATDLNLNSYSTPTTGSTAIGTSDAVQTAIGKLDHQSQIDQSNILYALNDGVKNLCPINNGSLSDSGYLNENGADGQVLINPIPSGSYKLVWTLSSTATECGFQLILAQGNASVSANRIQTETKYISNTTGTFTADITIPSGKTVTNLVVYMNKAGSASNVMICRADLYNQDSTYVPYALPNYDLTRLESEDRASLAEVVDSGAKNLYDFIQSYGFDNCAVDSNGEYTADTRDTRTALNLQATINNGNSVLRHITGSSYVEITANGIYSWTFVMPSGADRLIIGHNGSQRNGRYYQPITGLEAGKTYVFRINVTQATNASGIFKWKDIMICTKAAFGVSQKFVPYKATNYYLSETQSCKTTYTLASISVKADASRVIRITARCVHGNSMCKGIILSRNNLPSYYNNAANLVGRIEADYDNRELNLSCIVPPGNTTIYMWTKFDSDADNPVQLYVEYLT